MPHVPEILILILLATPAQKGDLAVLSPALVDQAERIMIDRLDRNVRAARLLPYCERSGLISTIQPLSPF
jgi:hypothetical protein